jgi:AraC family transcriptional regulator of adaptative response / DNA-3-methyladenine glycosylase II
MSGSSAPLRSDLYARALDARDARFDGLFFVGVTTTRVYCRPVCPARVTYPERRRFFDSAAAAERAGFRPCLRCRPELAPGRALIDAVPRLARVATNRIAAGALNGRCVAELAAELGVSERHLRRALEREIGVSPLELAQTHRLLLAKRLLADTTLPITRIAYASGFQSLRRFNSVFREHYRLSPSALRRAPRARRAMVEMPGELVRLTLAYRAPLRWSALVAALARDALPGVESADEGRYGRTVELEGRRGVVLARDAPAKWRLDVDLSPSLLPVLMPLLARLRQLFDLDAEPAVIDEYLARHGMTALVRQRPGVRVPGVMDGFEATLRVLLRPAVLRRVVATFGEPIDSGVPALTRLLPAASRLAEAEPARLEALGVPRRSASVLSRIARAMATGAMTVEPGSDVATARRALLAVDGIGGRLATTIVMRALHWPDAFHGSDRALQRAAAVSSAAELLARAEEWRPWRAYAAMHLLLTDGRDP